MELEQQRTGNPAMTFDEVSMERSKNFVKALQELKNLRPQLYSAAEYCEKSYLRSEQKQMILENLKDYAVRTLVNAVDHLGTVAYKLTDLLEQQKSDVSTMEMKISCINQQLLTCQIYSDKEGLRQQQLLAIIPRHHKHYILPLVSVVVDSKSDSAHKKVHFNSHVQTDAGERYLQERPHVQPSGTTASKTLSWHLASETKSTLKEIPRSVPRSEDPKFVAKNSDAEGGSQIQMSNLGPASSAAIKTLGVPWQDSQESSKPLKAYRSFDNPMRRDSARAPSRSKSMLSALLSKKKLQK